MSASLDKLTIRGFKSIRSLEDFELRSLNVFIGANGAGKSNLIDFFRMLRSLAERKLAAYFREGGGISDFLHNGRKGTEKMFFVVRFGDRGYSFTIKPGQREEYLLTDEARFYVESRSGWWNLGDSPDGESLMVNEAKSGNGDSQYSKPVFDSLTSWQIYHFHDTSRTAGMRHYEIVQDSGVLRKDASNIAPYLLRLRDEYADVYREILDSLRLVIPFFDDFILEPRFFGEAEKVNLGWRQKGSDYPMQPYHLSDGSIRFICLATALLQPDPPATIIFDEPELGLHPAAIAILAELIRNASTRMQLIVSTQSPALIDHFGIEDVVIVNRKDGASTFQRLQEDDFSAWLEQYSVGELWSKNVIPGGPLHE